MNLYAKNSYLGQDISIVNVVTKRHTEEQNLLTKTSLKTLPLPLSWSVTMGGTTVVLRHIKANSLIPFPCEESLTNSHKLK